MSRVLSVDSGESMAAAIDSLQSNEPIVIPTDTVYGLAALAGDEIAAARIFELKGRPNGQTLAVLVADVEQARSLVEVDERLEALALAFWPGGLTIVSAALSGFAESLTAADATIGVRVPQQSWVRSLASEVGPLVATSANLHGTVTPQLPLEVAELFPDTLVVDAGPGGDTASTVVRLSPDLVQILRTGSITEQQIQHHLRVHGRYGGPIEQT